MAQTMPPIIKRAHDRGVKEGVEIGKQKGVEIGNQDGIEIGKQEGVEIGAKLAKQETLAMLLTLRFGPLPEEVRSQIERITEISALDRSLELVLNAHALSDVLPQG